MFLLRKRECVTSRKSGHAVTTFVVLDWPFDFLGVGGYLLKESCCKHTSARKIPRYDHCQKNISGSFHARPGSLLHGGKMSPMQTSRGKNPNAWKVTRVCCYQIALTPFLTPSQVPQISLWSKRVNHTHGDWVTYAEAPYLWNLGTLNRFLFFYFQYSTTTSSWVSSRWRWCYADLHILRQRWQA